MDSLLDRLDAVVFALGARPVSGLDLAVAGGAALLLVVVVAAIMRSAAGRRRAEAAATGRAAELEGRVEALLKTQAEMSGRMQTIAEVFSSRQAEMNRAISDRLDGMGHRLNQSVGEQTRSTHESLKRLHERLAVLDAAQANISDLAGQVTTLSNILGNKQARGAFGQGRMEAIVADGLPKGAYAFQPTLKSGARPDCLVFMPNDAPPLVIDAKFPLEGYHSIKRAETAEAMKAAQAQFRADIVRHLKDIGERYLVAGETHDTAFMFVPSESVFAEIHERFEALVARAYQARVVIVSPSLLMLSIQVVQALLRDQRLREQAHVIQDEVMRLMADLGRLDDRVQALARHFGQAQRDIEQIVISTGKVTRRGRQIEGLGFGEAPERLADDGAAAETPAPPRLAAGR